MTMLIPGSEIFSSRPADPDELRRSLPTALQTHTVSQDRADQLDPLTYEVVRHRLWSVTDEMGEALKRMSGSPIVTDANDFDFAICDELGQEVQVGLYNTMLVGAVDLAIYWTLRHRAANPGIAEGDMFLCNDPWVGGGLHQNDVIVYQPVFHDGKLFAWTSAIAHQPDLGGVGLGSPPRTYSPNRCPPRPSRSSAVDSSSATSPTCGCAARASRCSSGLTCARRSGPTTSAASGCTP
jgi:N-methylhydantoinase B